MAGAADAPARLEPSWWLERELELQFELELGAASSPLDAGRSTEPA